jgi:thymidylate synthase
MLIAKCCNLTPRKFVQSIGDCHIYEPHFEAAGEQTMRVPYNFPKLKINKELNNVEDLEQLQFEDFELIDYQHHPKIKMDIVV